jgi:hypothetical protein
MTEESEFESRQCKIFLFSTASRLALGLTQPAIQGYQGVKRQECEADHSPSSSTEELHLNSPISHGIVLNYIIKHKRPLHILLTVKTFLKEGARGSVVGSGTMLQAGRSRVRFPMKSLDF